MLLKTDVLIFVLWHKATPRTHMHLPRVRAFKRASLSKDISSCFTFRRGHLYLCKVNQSSCRHYYKTLELKKKKKSWLTLIWSFSFSTAKTLLDTCSSCMHWISSQNILEKKMQFIRAARFRDDIMPCEPTLKKKKHKSNKKNRVIQDFRCCMALVP